MTPEQRKAPGTEWHHTTIEGSFLQEDNSYPKCESTKQQRWKTHEAKIYRTKRTDKSTIIAGDFNTLLSTIDRTADRKSSIRLFYIDKSHQSRGSNWNLYNTL